MHADKGPADVDSCVCLDMFERYGSLEACVASGSEGAASFGLWNDIHDFGVRDGLVFDDDGSVQVLAALGRDIDALRSENALKPFVNSFPDFRDGMATDLVA